MDNSTDSVLRTDFEEEKPLLFEGLTRAEETAALAALVVAGLAVCAVILRIAMPLIRKKVKKSKGPQPTLKENKSTNDLLGSATPSSASRASTLSRSSQSDYWKSEGDDGTAITTISTKTTDAKHSLFGNVRSDGISLPLYLPQMRSEEIPKSASAQRLNQELTSVISTPVLQRLQSLNLNDNYRDNWDRTFDPTNQHARSLSHVTHPSESRKIRELPEVHRPGQQSGAPELKTRF